MKDKREEARKRREALLHRNENLLRDNSVIVIPDFMLPDLAVVPPPYLCQKICCLVGCISPAIVVSPSNMS